MRKHSNLAFTLLVIGSGLVLAGCSNSEVPPNQIVLAAGAAGAPMAGTAGTMAGSGGSSGGMNSVGGMAGSSGAAGGMGGLAGSGGMGPTCEVGSLQPFARSDTDAAWDDNDFSDVVIDQAMCPVLVDVTWPHEAGWENADPSEANLEQVRFTLDSYPVVDDLTNKQLNVTIELAEDMLGPLATDGGYIVSLLSVSTFQRVVPVATGGAGGSAGSGGTDGGVAGMGGIGGTMAGMGGAGMSGAGGTAGMSGAGAGGMGGAAGMSAGSGGTDAAGNGGTAGDAGGAGGSGGEMTVTETGYAEAETPEEERRVLYYPGDRVTVRFPLPAKTAEGSYDPSTAIKVNIRVYNLFDTGEEEPTGVAGAGGVAGMGGVSGAGAFGMSGMSGMAGAGGMSGAAGSAGRSGTAGTSGMAGTSGTAGASGMAGMSGEGGTAGAGGAGGTSGAGGTGSMRPVPVYDYVTSTFAITSFTVTDVGAP